MKNAAGLGAAFGALIGIIPALALAAVLVDLDQSMNSSSDGAEGAYLVVVLLLSVFGPVLSVGIVLVLAVTWGIAWWALPRVVDLEPTGAEQLPAQYGEQPAAPRPPMSPALRWVVIAVSAGLGGLLVTNIVMSFAHVALPREGEEIIAFGILVASAAAIGFAVWRLTDRRST